ncbi:MAG: aldo/keto reductase [Oscillospiraceae bacterium]|nr:aldo/keto reductase [Oscillospiraceae bacterium]
MPEDSLTLKLSNGISIPRIGFGLAALTPGKDLEDAVSAALDAGYRLFDNAPFYANESAVGAALREGKVKREELFISTKLPNACHAYRDAREAFERSLKTLGVDYLDMYLIHFPIPKQNLYCEAWRAFEDMYEEGLIRAIGVSNFLEPHLEDIFSMCRIKPMVNELECNPYLAIPALRSYCRKHEIQIISWFPLGGPQKLLRTPKIQNYKKLLEDDVIKTIAAAHGKSAAQVALRWAVDSDIVPIPKSSRPERIRENIDLFDFSLTNEEMIKISGLDHDRRLGPAPGEFNDLTSVFTDLK